MPPLKGEIMCIASYTTERKKKELSKLPEIFYCWKLFIVNKKNRKPFNGQFYSFDFKPGWNTTEEGPGFHSYRPNWLTRIFAFIGIIRPGMPRGDEKTVRCKIKKSDIADIGIFVHDRVIVSKRIWIPESAFTRIK